MTPEHKNKGKQETEAIYGIVESPEELVARVARRKEREQAGAAISRAEVKKRWEDISAKEKQERLDRALTEFATDDETA